jgi:hypothetical protein
MCGLYLSIKQVINLFINLKEDIESIWTNIYLDMFTHPPLKKVRIKNLSNIFCDAN